MVISQNRNRAKAPEVFVSNGLDARIDQENKKRSLDVPDSWSARTSLGNMFRGLEVGTSKRDDAT